MNFKYSLQSGLHVIKSPDDFQQSTYYSLDHDIKNKLQALPEHRAGKKYLFAVNACLVCVILTSSTHMGLYQASKTLNTEYY